MPVSFPAEHRANLSGYRTDARAVPMAEAPWPVRRRIGVFVALGLAAWVVVLSPFLLFN